MSEANGLGALHFGGNQCVNAEATDVARKNSPPMLILRVLFLIFDMLNVCNLTGAFTRASYGGW